MERHKNKIFVDVVSRLKYEFVSSTSSHITIVRIGAGGHEPVTMAWTNFHKDFVELGTDEVESETPESEGWL